MTPLNLEQVEEIFQNAIDLPPEQRAGYLSKVCAGSGEMRSEVDALILAYEESADFIERPAMEIDAAVVAGSLGGALIGQTISHYRIIERLGEGGMGVVYLAQDTRLGRRIALKLLPARFTIDAERVHRFEQEARAASALNHPNIVTIHEIGQLDASHFIATEFIEGVTLREHLGAGRLEVDEALAVATQVASALTAAHAARIIHRDIKPENIMLRSDGYVKVLDFGLAKLAGRRGDTETRGRGDEGQTLIAASQRPRVSASADGFTSPGVIMGTVNYMSPEQSRGQEVDARTDIWSLGVLLYEMLAGSTPFKGETPSHVIVSILEKEPLPLAGDSADVPAELERIFRKALHKNRDERYQTARELHLDLQNLKQDREVEARLGRPIYTGEGKPETATRAAVATGERRPGSITGETGVVQTTSSGEYLVSQIKRHRRSFAAVGVVAVVAALALGYTYFFRPRWTNRQSINSNTTTQNKRIAVMPFANESGDPKLEYLSDGLAGDLIESLSEVPGLEVRALSTVVRYKGTNSNAQEIGQKENVEAVLFGKLIKIGEDLSLQVELVDSRNGNILWPRTYQKKISGLVVLPSELARDLISKLSVPVTVKAQEKVAKRGTENSDAYRLYLSGVFYARKITEQDIREAIDLFSQAIQKDPHYAKAYAAMAAAHGSLTLCCDGRPSELLEEKLAAQKAVDLDDELAEGHSALAASIYMYDWKWKEAEKEYLRALDLDPNSAMSHFLYGDFLGRMGGRSKEALAQKERAAELEPFEPYFAARIGSSPDPEKALKQILYAIELDRNYWFSHVMAAGRYADRKEYDKAIAEAQLAKKLSPDQTWSDASLSRILVNAGKPEEARAILDQLLLRSKSRFVPPYHIAMVYNNLDDKEQALKWLEKAYAIHDAKMTFIATMPWKNVHDDPRFQDILRRVGFVDAK